MKKIIKEWFELFVKSLWLKEIGRAIRKRDRLDKAAKRQQYIAKKLLERYNELYEEKLNGSD